MGLHSARTIFNAGAVAKPRSSIVSVLGLLLAALPIASPPALSKTPPAPYENPKRDIKALKRLALKRAKSLHTTPDVVAKDEKRHNRLTRDALAPLLSAPLDKTEADTLKSAFKALRGGDVATAMALRARLQSPVARKLVTWDRLRRGLGQRAELERFINENPLWPNRWKFIEKIEQRLFDDADHAATRAFFKKRKPRSPYGVAALASADLAAGRSAQARRTVASAWRNMRFSADEEAAFLSRHGNLLSAGDHKWRLDRLLTNDFRWRGSRNRRAAVVRRQMKRVPRSERRIANARLAVFLRKKGALSKLNKLPPETGNDWSLAYHRVQQLRRSKRTTQAATLLLSAPTDTSAIVNPEAWWVERRVNAYVQLRKKNPKLAYAIVREAGDLSVNERKEQGFVAGWLALRYLGDTDAALKHFTVFHKAADGPLSRSKSAYWMARVHEARGNRDEADRYYREAAKVSDTFHGQLSRQILAGGKPVTVDFDPPAAASTATVERFRNQDAVKAAVLATRAGLGRTISRPFLANLANQFETEAEVALVAHLTRELGDTQQSLRIGKRAIGRGMNLIYYAYPLHAFPDYKPLRKPPETAFLLGIARQESEFNTGIVSGAGARGILQVMKITARHVCRDYKIRCNYRKLSTNESYNTRIASAYIGDRMGEFSGSYILGLAGYNAGPGRARQWIRQFGDPRAASMDPMDWIERIPFTETRKYVQKVLSNIQVYRARLGEKRSLRLLQDLRRAKAGRPGGQLYAPGGRIPRRGA